MFLSGVLASGISGITSIFHRGTSSSQKQQAVNADLQAALAGDLQAAHTILFAQTENHTHETRGYYAQAETVLRAQRPDVVAAVLHPGSATASTPAPAPVAVPRSSGTSTSGLQGQLNNVADAVRDAVAQVREAASEAVQNIGAGASSKLASDIAPTGSAQRGAITIPTDKNTLLFAGAAVAVVVVLLVLMRWKR